MINLGNKQDLKFDSDNDVETTLKKLDKIFTSNPGAWMNYSPLYLTKYGDDNYKFLRYLKYDQIKIYEFNYEEPKEPATSEEQKMFRILARHSKARSPHTIDLYWRACCFFNKHGYNLTNARDGTLMGIAKKLDIPKEAPMETFYSDCIEGVIVRCGEIDANKILNLSWQGTQYLWLFPFDYEYEQDHLKCYLFEIDKEIGVKLHEEVLEMQRRIWDNHLP